MRQRGRKSAEAKALATIIPGGFGQRPEPPAELADDEAIIWRATTASEDPGLFGTQAQRDMLKDYCRHRAATDKVSEVISLFQSEWLKSADGAKRYHGLLRMQDLSSRAAADKATKLRLTNQSRYTPQAAATAARNLVVGRKPWEE